MQTVVSLVSLIQELMQELKISATTALDNRVLGSLAIPSSTGAPVLQSTEVMYCSSNRPAKGTYRLEQSWCFSRQYRQT